MTEGRPHRTEILTIELPVAGDYQSGHHQVGTEEFVCTVSVGIATTADANHGPDALLQEADLALYRFAANQRAAVAFCAALIEEFGKFPTDPGAVSPGEPA